MLHDDIRRFIFASELCQMHHEITSKAASPTQPPSHLRCKFAVQCSTLPAFSVVSPVFFFTERLKPTPIAWLPQTNGPTSWLPHAFAPVALIIFNIFFFKPLRFLALRATGLGI